MAHPLRGLVGIAVLFGALGVGGNAEPPGGTAITNVATATFQDAAGAHFATSSNGVTVTIARISELTVTPNQSKPDPKADQVPLGEPVRRSFIISNTGNVSDSYRIDRLSAGPMTIQSLAFETSMGALPVGRDGKSPAVEPGKSIALDIVFATGELKVGQAVPIELTIRTTPRRDTEVAHATGQQWAIGAAPPRLTGPAGGSSPVLKTVNRSELVQVSPHGDVRYDIVAENSGGSPAADVILRDILPSGMVLQERSIEINGAPAASSSESAGQQLTIHCGTLAAGQQVDVSFKASAPGPRAIGTTLVNVATISADYVAPQQTTAAFVFIGSGNVIYDGYAGSASPIDGATVTLLDAAGSPVDLLQSGGASDPAARNPQVTGPRGDYEFALEPSHVSPGGERYSLTVSAPGYLNRKLELHVVPNDDDTAYNVTISSADGQPIAVAGGFVLTTHSVTLSNVVGWFGNVPLFTAQGIAVTKSADVSTAQPGDRIQYTIDVSNTLSKPVTDVHLVDTLPPGLVFATGTAAMDGMPSPPVVDGRTLTWSIASMAAGAIHSFTYYGIVFPSVPAGTNLTNTALASGEVRGGATVRGSANVTILVISGAFTQRIPIVGRVFYDLKGSGSFARGDKGIAGVRIFMEDGSSVLSDTDGRFSFPGARPGMHVLRLDVTTLPSNARPIRGCRMNESCATQQLVHGLLDDGIIEDVQFALGSQ